MTAPFLPELVRRCICATSRSGDVVLDPMCGGGTTGIVALREGRNFIGFDVSPRYVELAKERIKVDCAG